MQMHMPIECRAEAVQEVNAVDARRQRPVWCRRQACGLAHELFHFAQKNLREGGDGLGTLGEQPLQSLETEITHCRTGTGGTT